MVPRGRLDDLFAFAGRLQKKHGLAVAAFGHAGDGNIHVNIMLDRTQPGADARAEAALDDLFAQIIAWGGAITGEHGIGLAKARWWPQAIAPRVRQLHQQVKQALDPHGILNPANLCEPKVGRLALRVVAPRRAAQRTGTKRGFPVVRSAR